MLTGINLAVMRISLATMRISSASTGLSLVSTGLYLASMRISLAAMRISLAAMRTSLALTVCHIVCGVDGGRVCFLYCMLELIMLIKNEDYCRNADSTVSTLNGLNVGFGLFFSCNVVNMSWSHTA